MLSLDLSQQDILLQSSKDAGIIDPYVTIIKRIDLNYSSQNITTHTILEGKSSESFRDSYISTFTPEDLKSLDIIIESSESAIHPQRMYLHDLDSGIDIDQNFSGEDECVYVVFFWANWSKSSVKELEDVWEMVIQHPEWENKAQVLAVSLDSKQTDAFTGKQSLLNRFRNLAFRDIQDIDNVKQYGIEAAPELYLIYKARTLWRGHPNSRNIQYDIHDLLNSLPFPIIRPNILFQDINTKLAQVLTAYEQFHDSHFHLTPPKLKLQLRTSYDGQHINEKYSAYLLGSFIYKYAEDVQILYQLIQTEFPLVQFKVSFVDTIESISLGKTCSLCSKTLRSDETQYLCMYCNPVHIHCEECENSSRDGKGSGKYAHFHNLYKIHPKANRLNEIMIHSGLANSNVYLEDEPESIVHSRIGCDYKGKSGCEGTVQGIRWKCAHCEDFDYCENCERKWQREESEEMRRDGESSGHHVWHVMIKIPYEI